MSRGEFYGIKALGTDEAVVRKVYPALRRSLLEREVAPGSWTDELLNLGNFLPD